MFVCPLYVCTPYTFVHPICLDTPWMSSGSSVHLHVQGGICMWYGDREPICLEAPCMFWCPHMSDAPMFPFTSVYSWGICMWYGGYTPYVGVWGGISTCVRHFGFCQYIHCSQSVGCFLLNWILGCLLCFMLLCFFCNFHYVSIPQLWLLLLQWLWYLLVCHLFISYSGPSLLGLPATLDQCDVVLLPLLTPWCPGGVIGLASVL